ncbi:MAG: PIG-L family deacetylase [Chloroflexi bacterium]|nr:PIG-L family deacetylase [Chloroflexota bacterium]
MTHLILSPHADDAVLSCGGLMFTLKQQGESVEVLTLTVADVPQPPPASPVVLDLHPRWGLGDNPYIVRRAEDKAAIERLGAKIVFGDWLDAIYRVDAKGQVYYPSYDSLFAEIHPDDPVLKLVLDYRQRVDLQALYIPLAAGNHVDHQLVRNLAILGLQGAKPNFAVYFYEEYPYAAETNEVLHFHSGDKPRLFGSTAVQTALKTLPGPALPTVRAFDEAALKAKIEAVACYASQISSFWNTTEQMAQNVREYARFVGGSAGIEFGERLWILDTNSH